MDEDRYIWCRNCNAVHHVSPFDRAPIYTLRHGEIAVTPSNDWREFMNRHAGHRLEPLKETGDDFYSGKPWEPMSVRFFEVSNGEETLLLRRSRSSIEEPFCYDVVNGRLVQTGLCLEIQADAIRKEMKLHFDWAPATPLEDKRIDRFVSILRDVVSQLAPSGINAQAYSESDANVTYCEIDATVVERVIEKCRSCFRPDEVESLRRFMDTHRDVDDVTAVVRRRIVSIDPQPHDSQRPSAR